MAKMPAALKKFQFKKKGSSKKGKAAPKGKKK